MFNLFNIDVNKILEGLRKPTWVVPNTIDIDKKLAKLHKNIKFCKKCGEYIYKPKGAIRYVCSNPICPERLPDYDN